MVHITVAKGDGIGPEITNAVLDILKAAEVKIHFDYITIGESLYLEGISSGIDDIAWASIRQNKILLKGPITTPLGKGYKSLNVTFRKTLGLYANVRPVISYLPFVQGSTMNMVIIRENEEDLYAGIEYMPTHDNYLSLKLISQQGCEKIIRYAFEYAKNNGRKKVTCITKNNIMKISDGAFANIFFDIAKEYNEIEANHMIVDIGAARIAAKPSAFDVIVTLNLYGDIISDIAAEISGAVGLAGSANIGTKYAMFEAMHGSAPDIAGQNKANPSGMLNAAILMLKHLGMNKEGAVIRNAWLTTLENGLHTADIFQKDLSSKLLSTDQFSKAVIENLGKKPQKLQVDHYMENDPVIEKTSYNISSTNKIEQIDSADQHLSMNFSDKTQTSLKKNKLQENKISQSIIGCDIYLNLFENLKSIQEIIKDIQNISNKCNCLLQAVAQKGLIIWPKCESESINDITMIQVRFYSTDKEDLMILQKELERNQLHITMIYYLYEYGEIKGFSKMQGE